jgi:hypothetical protein
VLAVIVGFLQPTYKIVVQVFSRLDTQEMNDPGVFLLRLLDAAMLYATAQDEQHIEPVLADGHGRKDRSHFEKHSRLCRSRDDFAAALNQTRNAVIQLDNLWRLAVENLLHAELPARVRLIAVGELTTAAWTGPEGFRFSGVRLPFPHGISDGHSAVANTSARFGILGVSGVSRIGVVNTAITIAYDLAFW